MRPSVTAAFPGLTRSLEGDLPFLYLDVKCLVTTGLGCLVDPVSLATPLDWQRPDGTYASVDEIEAAWLAVKSRRDLALHGGGAFASVTTIRLSPPSIDHLACQRAADNEEILRGAFDGYDDLPANAQLGLLSMSWAAGPYTFRGFPRFDAALRARDWATCSMECGMDATGNPGLVPRNRVNARLFATCLDAGDPSEITGWP